MKGWQWRARDLGMEVDSAAQIALYLCISCLVLWTHLIRSRLACLLVSVSLITRSYHDNFLHVSVSPCDSHCEIVQMNLRKAKKKKIVCITKKHTLRGTER